MRVQGARGLRGPGGHQGQLGLSCCPSSSSHLQDLKDVTHNIYYENYRVCRLNQSHTLPRGPGWVALAPAPTCAPATPRRSKARLQVRDKRDKEH